MDPIESVVRRFREAGLKITPQRICILEVLQGNSSHPSAEQVFFEVRRRYPNISFTTVYKTLQTLRDIGQITEINIDSERAHFDPTVDGHGHAFCLKCRSILDIPLIHTPSLPPASPIPDFEVREVQTHFVGICSACRPSGGG